MNDILGVSVGNCFAEFPYNLIRIDASELVMLFVAQEFIERIRQIVEHKVEGAFGIGPCAMSQAHDIRMSKPLQSRSFAFVERTLDLVWMRSVKDLDGNVYTTRAPVLREIDCAHAALADWPSKDEPAVNHTLCWRMLHTYQSPRWGNGTPNGSRPVTKPVLRMTVIYAN